MSILRKQYCVANWKMNFTISDIESFISRWKNKNINTSYINTIICPSFTELNITSALLSGSSLNLGAQDVYYESEGAFTGEVSCRMLKEVGCECVIIGHSERRSIFHETDNLIQKKLDKIIAESMYPILCIGESEKERNSGDTKEILSRQLRIACNNLNRNEIATFVIAYEPVWAIGTGVTATIDMINESHQNIRNILNNNGFNGDSISILYGGSVSDSNAPELSSIDNVDGFLIGGASLDVDKFYSIYNQL